MSSLWKRSWREATNQNKAKDCRVLAIIRLAIVCSSIAQSDSSSYAVGNLIVDSMPTRFPCVMSAMTQCLTHHAKSINQTQKKRERGERKKRNERRRQSRDGSRRANNEIKAR